MATISDSFDLTGSVLVGSAHSCVEGRGHGHVGAKSEAAIADIRAVAERIAESGVPAVFLETTIHPRTIQAVIDAAGALGASVKLGGDLYGDALGDRSTLAGTYLGMMYVNTRTIVEALGGTLPGLPGELEAWRERSGLLEESR